MSADESGSTGLDMLQGASLKPPYTLCHLDDALRADERQRTQPGKREEKWLTTSAFFMSEEASAWPCPELNPSDVAWLLLQCESLKRDPGTAQLTFSNLHQGTAISAEAGECCSHRQGNQGLLGAMCQVVSEYTAAQAQRWSSAEASSGSTRQPGGLPEHVNGVPGRARDAFARHGAHGGSPGRAMGLDGPEGCAHEADSGGQQAQRHQCQDGDGRND